MRILTEKRTKEQVNKIKEEKEKEMYEKSMKLENTSSTLNKNIVKYIELEKKYDVLLSDYNTILKKLNKETEEKEKLEIDVYKYQNNILHVQHKQGIDNDKYEKIIEKYQKKEDDLNDEIRQLKNDNKNLKQNIDTLSNDVINTSTKKKRIDEKIIEKNKEIDMITGEALAYKSLKVYIYYFRIEMKMKIIN